ncbi:bifunctional oligoribonuclease/PAP phosphatase NrnA [Treponema phagedenis]|uniref:Bifunctional oligoribonuclease/PAP phosphatase NrnA n=1 Tax=Treponema phagedenis TaxID=162 RepID=A0A0B7H026_TREPH|nr:bifunctional oligoribonuclease/PAP phosphatase NrnA [Treponema phagedenis]EFW37862.1 DHHA1 domain protein [Treponema phagedenis F0421]NVP25407.1 bifunctional oligoribonuclease/PAP phosphatase NrnA [Treponema phagedenis]QEJ94899.1 bifunctional oligoribonuclease/PAP phosphatase NrnA [Treponema phagedenis]QEJ97884.1 bifunctional oligoribonuclease/PAP phosphatase NrnA [Treponema phagedenis]QEK00800.1 bifunctional oligoribonuclease/PAP phosphatase NrnA [Treponema phagedenis]
MDTIQVPEISDELVTFINSHSVFLIAGHKEPDGDCIGSSLALSLFLQRLGKKTVLLSAGPFKRIEIKCYEELFFEHVPENIVPNNETALFVVDCSNVERTGDLAEELKPFKPVFIDHHATNTEASPASLIMKTSPSTTYLIQHIIEKMTGEVTEEEAKLLFFGLSTDTGFFRHLDYNSAEVFAAASRLVRAKASPKRIFAQINGGRSFKSRMLISKILSRLTPYYDGKLMLSFETYEDTQEFGLEGRDSDALYQLIQSIAGVEAIVIIRQESETHCSVGFRSFDKIDVSVIAASFGGGGHKQASGLYIKGQINNLIPKFVKAFENQMLLL